MGKVVIVGAGIGGLATGLRLLKQGHEVTIYDKNDTVGGRVNRIQDNGFNFDSTASIAIMPQDYRELFESVGLDIEDYLDIVMPSYTYKIFDTKGRSLTLYRDLSDLSKEFELKSDTDIDDYMEFIDKSYKKYEITSNSFLENPMTEFGDFFNLANLEKIMEISPFNSAYDEIEKYIGDELLRDALAYQTMYIGLSPYNCSSIFTLIPASTQVEGMAYFAGGMSSYTNAVANAYKDLGGILHLNSNVDKVISEDGRAKAIAIEGRLIEADDIIINADYSYAIKSLIDYDYDKYMDINEFDYTCSVFMLYLGLDERFDKLLLHNIIVQEDFEKNVNCIFNGTLPPTPPIYVYNPTIQEERKSNYQTLNCLIRVPNLRDLSIQWDDDICKTMEDRILNAIIKIPGLERLREHIVYKKYLTPRDLEYKYNSSYGCAFGISPYLDTTNIFRPSIKDLELENLYYVGDSIHPGAGISIIIKGSKLVADIIDEG